MLAMSPTAPRGIRFPALWLTSIASISLLQGAMSLLKFGGHKKTAR